MYVDSVALHQYINQKVPTKLVGGTNVVNPSSNDDIMVMETGAEDTVVSKNAWEMLGTPKGQELLASPLALGLTNGM